MTNERCRLPFAEQVPYGPGAGLGTPLAAFHSSIEPFAADIGASTAA
jgi:hypothetical protein